MTVSDRGSYGRDGELPGTASAYRFCVTIPPRHRPRTFVMNKTSATVTAVVSWAISLWTCRVFLASLPYKFTRHPDTQHIFGTIGAWMEGIFGRAVGRGFADFGPFVVGGFELLTSTVLLLPALLWVVAKIRARDTTGMRAKWHCAGGLMAAAVMTGAVFFHLFTPLGVEVLHQGESDGGSLFYAAVSILVLGVVMFALNARVLRAR